MAISGGDGSIILTTKVDKTGLNNGIKSMKSGIKSLSSSLTALGSVIGAVFSVTAIVNFSKEASKFATETEASVQRLIDIYGSASESVGDFIDANARAIGMSKASASSFASVYGNLFSVWADQATNAELTNQYLNMTAVVASKTGRTVQDVQERVRSGLLGNTEAIEDLGVFVNVKTIEMTDAFKRMADGRSWEQLDAYTQQQVRSMAILEQATAKYGTTVADTTATTRAQYQAAYEDFQNTWGQVVNVVLIPVLKVATQVLSVLTRGLQIIAGISGKTIESNSAFESQASSIGGAVENQEALTKAVEDTAKAQKKSLAGFDQINKLTESTAGASGGAGTSGGGAVGGGVADLGLADLTYDNSIVGKISGDLAAIMGIVGVALVAVGLILIFTGHIAWGIGFIIAGASIFAISMATLSQTDQTTPISEMLMKIMAIAGVALVAIGLILLTYGQVLWGISFLIAGAGMLAVSVVSASKGNVTDEAKDLLLSVLLIAGTAMLALGIILMCAGVFNPLSIGLVVAGAVGLASAVAINPQEVGQKIKKFFQDNAGIITGISLALVVLGILVCFTPLLGLGIGLIVVGVAGLAATVALNWNSVKEKVTSAFNSVINWVKTWGLLVLGIILTISGVAVPLGLALIKKGSDNLVSAKDPTWTAFLDKIKEVCEKIKAYWRSNMAKYFTKEYWGKKGKDMVKGLIKKVLDGLNSLISEINNFGFNLPDVLGGGKVGFNIPKLNIPQLAKGAVIPPNKSFLAVLGDQKSGTNIEAPLSTIEEAVQNVLSRNGNLGGGVIENVIMLDGEVLYRSQKNIERRKGVSFATGGSW